MNLHDFLRARLNEDEQMVEAALSSERRREDWTVTYKWLRLTVNESGRHHSQAIPSAHTPARALAEVEAKRRIVDLVGGGSSLHNPRDCQDCDVLRALASVYADHQDYREEWMPSPY